MPSLEAYRAGYLADWGQMKVRPQWAGSIDRAARYAMQYRDRYLRIEEKIGIPWGLVAAWHWREAGGSFKGVLHNGEHIIGTGRKTRLIPAGRGPFDSWEEAAIDALRLKGLQNIKEWSPERICYESERFNGFGYRKAGRPKSPYLWSGSNIYIGPGKYTSDGSYSSGVTDQQLGCIPHYRRILELEAEAGLRRNGVVMGIFSRIRQSIKAGIVAVAGLFSAENLGLVKDFFSEGGIFSPTNIMLIAAIGLGAWFLINAFEKGTTPKEEPDQPPDDGHAGEENER